MFGFQYCGQNMNKNTVCNDGLYILCVIYLFSIVLSSCYILYNTLYLVLFVIFAFVGYYTNNYALITHRDGLIETYYYHIVENITMLFDGSNTLLVYSYINMCLFGLFIISYFIFGKM